MLLMRMMVVLLGLLALIADRTVAHAAETPQTPYFASLKRDRTNVRIGPGPHYPVKWVYTRQALPVEVLARFDVWRKVRATDGQTGWVNAVMLTPARTALVSPWGKHLTALLSNPQAHSRIMAKLGPGVIVVPKHCDRTWCAVAVPGRSLYGYVPQPRLWGVYADETLGTKTLWATITGALF